MDFLRWGVFRKVSSILDLGGGWAIHSELIADKFKNSKVVKTDLSIISLLNLTKKLGKFYNPGILKVVCHGEKLPFASSSFDIIIFSQVLEHIPDDDFALKECHRLLKKNGKLILAVPNCYKDMFTMFHPLERIFDEFGHIHEYSAELLKNKLEVTGFKVKKQRYHCFFVFYIFAWLERTRFSKSIQKFLLGHPLLESIARIIITSAMLLENVILGHLSRGSLSIEFVAVKE